MQELDDKALPFGKMKEEALLKRIRPLAGEQYSHELMTVPNREAPSMEAAAFADPLGDFKMHAELPKDFFQKLQNAKMKKLELQDSRLLNGSLF